jgi:hypothetical protein
MKANAGVHPQCAEAIQRLVHMENPKFPDFAELKTYGNDKYSAMGWEDLQQFISEKTIAVVEQFEDEANILSALRWIARGLPVSLAIRKVRADHSLYRYKTPNQE